MRPVTKIITARQRLPLDGYVAPSGAYSFRRLLTSYKANKAFNVIRASDSATIDIGFKGDNSPDIETLTSFLAGTTGKIVTWYDQKGGFDLTQATDSNRPTVVLTAINSKFPCMQVTAATQTIAAANNLTPATGTMSFVLVYNRANSTSTPSLRFNGNNNRFQGRAGVANGWQLVGGTSGTISTTANDAAWHISSGSIADANSAVKTDSAAVNAAAVTGNTTAAPPAIVGVNSNTYNFFEAVIWDNILLSASERVNINNNYHLIIASR